MTEPVSSPLPAQFQLDPSGSTKRPDQLVSVLTRAFQREFSKEFDQIQISHDAETAMVSVTCRDAPASPDEFDEATAKRVEHVARTTYNDFVTSPWY